jgi:hypothetical protein
MHCIFCVDFRVARPVLEGQHWVPRRWCQKGSRNWLPDAGASISLALEPWRWERSKIRLLTLAHLLRWRLRNAGVEKGAEIASLTLTHQFRWCLTNASVGHRAKFGCPTQLPALDGTVPRGNKIFSIRTKSCFTAVRNIERPN